MVQQVSWEEIVVADYRKRIIIDCDSPILAFKANRDRYTTLPNQKNYAGLPHLGSRQSEDALTWNVLRSLQRAKRLDTITHKLRIGDPRSLLLWALAPEIDGASANLQYQAGSIIRKYDGILPGQITEPDIIILGTSGIAVIECKLSEPDQAPSHLWEGGLESVKKRLPGYVAGAPDLINIDLDNDEIVPVYQLVRLAFYAVKLGVHFGVDPVLVSLSNKHNWSRSIGHLHKSASELWEAFLCDILQRGRPRCESLFWQDIREQVKPCESLEKLCVYLSNHPCLQGVDSE